MKYLAPSILLGLGVSVLLFFRHPQFGKLPRGKRLRRIKQSPHYRHGQFHNLETTPSFTTDTSYLEIMRKFLFARSERTRPRNALPSMKTDLMEWDSKDEALVWFGHSSYFLQVQGKKILVDPVFSGSASPLPYGTRAFSGTDAYTPADMPYIDYLIITHDHWDHLDFKTIKALMPKVGTAICGLGTGAHLEAWGYDEKRIREMDWEEVLQLEAGIKLYTVTGRHFSGRTFKRNTSLWLSFVLETPQRKIFLGGDSGFGSHFRDIGKRFGPFDLAILENGQYNHDWKYIHMLPDQFFTAARELGARKVLPVHHSKFSLALHAWDDPLRELERNWKKGDPQLLHPMIGQKVELDQDQEFSKWWEGID